MFRHKVPAIKVARDRLLDLPVEQARTGALVLGGLRRACELADTLDSCITEDMTFAKHFFNELATLPHDDESHWMNLLEDLALIFRAKRLAFPDLPEEGEERRLLEFFETSEEWGDPETELRWKKQRSCTRNGMRSGSCRESRSSWRLYSTCATF